MFLRCLRNKHTFKLDYEILVCYISKNREEAEWPWDLLYEVPLDTKNECSLMILCDSQATLTQAYFWFYNRK